MSRLGPFAGSALLGGLLALGPTGPTLAAPESKASAPAEEASIRRILVDYERAIETEDLALFKTVKPDLSAEEEEKLRRSFQAVESHEVEINVLSIEMDGAQATVRLGRRDTINHGIVSAFSQVMRLGKGPGGWVIQKIGQ